MRGALAVHATRLAGTKAAPENPTMNKILVPLDGSPRSPLVLTKALEVARATGGRLVLMRAIGLPADVPQDFWRSTDESLLELLERRAKAYLAQCEELVPEGERGGTMVVVGSPWQAICETARSLRFDLVIIGSHGYAGVDRLLGTTAAKVVNHAPCSVLVARETVADGASS
jgi:nucleotide-binding universal stress UspA family protein